MPPMKRHAKTSRGEAVLTGESASRGSQPLLWGWYWFWTCAGDASFWSRDDGGPHAGTDDDEPG